MNILLTSVGRRAYIVKYFKEILKDCGKIHAGNSDDKTVAFHYADHHVITPLIYDEKYIPFLLEYCKNNSIDALISLFDIDLYILAKNKEEFEKIGTKVVVSDPKFIEICNDKVKTYRFLEKHGFKTPKTYTDIEEVKREIHSGNLFYPLVVKPRFGCGSIAVSIAENESDLDYLYKKTTREVERSYLKYESANTTEKAVIQECISGQEYGADIINDLHGNNRSIVVRKKIAMRSGETDIATLVDNTVIKNELKKLGELTRHIANLDCDIFLTDNKPYILEMNARFGGGYPFSHMGGCNLPLAIVEWLKGNDVSDDVLNAESGITGYKELYITKE